MVRFVGVGLIPTPQSRRVNRGDRRSLGTRIALVTRNAPLFVLTLKTTEGRE